MHVTVAVAVADESRGIWEHVSVAAKTIPIRLLVARHAGDACKYLENEVVDVWLVGTGFPEALLDGDFLGSLAEQHPDALLILVTDAQSVPSNVGRIFRTVPIPIQSGQLCSAIRDAVRHVACTFLAGLLSDLTLPLVDHAGEPRGWNVSATSQDTLDEPAQSVTHVVGLSLREREVLDLLKQGYTSPEVATKLRISVFTVRNHTKAIYRKLGVSSRTMLG
jgi:DNA-binding NarL/FixJ family response regulator